MYMLEGDWESAGVELFVLAVGVAAVGVVRHLRRRALQVASLARASSPVRSVNATVAAKQETAA